MATLTDAPVNATNEWISDLLDIATERGFTVIEVSSALPGFVRLRDPWGTEIEIRQRSVGRISHDYVSQLTPVQSK